MVPIAYYKKNVIHWLPNSNIEGAIDQHKN